MYDVSQYAPQHPGAEQLILDTAARQDASELFGLAQHSLVARKLFTTLVAPGVHAMPRPVPLRDGTVRPRRTASDHVSLSDASDFT